MPRAPRIEFPGAVYHVMNRGNQLGPIFSDDVDREIFLKTLGEAAKSSGWSIHAYVLMGNHYHLLVETHRATLVKGMQFLNSTYTRRYNVRHKIFGHLFQGRYKALLVDIEEGDYFLTVSDYIHLNPIRAHMLPRDEKIWESRWNSAGWFCGKHGKLPNWLRWERVFGELGCDGWSGRSRRRFRDYISRRVQEESGGRWDGRYDEIRRGWRIGSEEFKEEMKEKLRDLARKPREEDSWSGEAVEEMEQDRARRLLDAGARKFKLERVDELDSMHRALLARWLRSRTKVAVKWLAAELGSGNSGSMSFLIWQAGTLIESNRKVARFWKALESVKNQ